MHLADNPCRQEHENLDIINHNGSTIGLKLGGTLITATATELNILDGITATTAELNYVDTTAGTAQASKALIVDSSRNISNINNISLTGLLSTINTNDTATNINYQRWINYLPIANNIVTVLQMNNVGMDFGTESNHPIGFITNNAEQMTISSTSTRILQTTTSTSTSTGALIVTGGVGIGGALNINGSIIGFDIIRTTDNFYQSTNKNSGHYVGNWGGAGFWGIGAHSSSSVRIGTCSDISGTWSGYANVQCNSIYANGSTSVSVGAYAYFRSDQQVGSSGATTANYSGYLNGRIACNGEINVISDKRMKNNINLLNNQYCKNFILNITPVEFKYNNDESQKHFGYIAQDVYKQGFEDLVALYPEEGLEEIIEDDGFINPKDIAFVMSTNELIPILHKNILFLYQDKEILEQKNNELENKVNILEQKNNENETKITSLEIENQLLKEQIQDILVRLSNKYSFLLHTKPFKNLFLICFFKIIQSLLFLFFNNLEIIL